MVGAQKDPRSARGDQDTGAQDGSERFGLQQGFAGGKRPHSNRKDEDNHARNEEGEECPAPIEKGERPWPKCCRSDEQVQEGRYEGDSCRDVGQIDRVKPLLFRREGQWNVTNPDQGDSDRRGQQSSAGVSVGGARECWGGERGACSPVRDQQAGKPQREYERYRAEPPSCGVCPADDIAQRLAGDQEHDGGRCQKAE